MSKPNDLLKDIDTIQNIMQIAHSSILVSKELRQPENYYIVYHNEYLKYTINIHWRIAIIELYKLFPFNTKNDKYSIEFLIENIEQSKYSKQNSIPIASVTKWKMMLSNITSFVRDIQRLRNECYAHERYNFSGSTHTITPDNIIVVTDIINEIMNDILIIHGEPPFVYDMFNFQLHDLKAMLQTLKDDFDRLKKMEEEL